MKTTLLILMVAAPVGAIDVVYFHLWKFRLFEQPQSQKEEVVHLIRGALFPIGLAILIIGRPEGLWFWATLGLFAFDSLNSLVDGLLEPSSRAPLVVPPAELAIHYLGTTFVGAATASFAIDGWSSRSSPSALVGHGDDFLPSSMLAGATVSVVLGILLWAFEATLFSRARRRMTPVSPSPTPTMV